MWPHQSSLLVDMGQVEFGEDISTTQQCEQVNPGQRIAVWLCSLVDSDLVVSARTLVLIIPFQHQINWCGPVCKLYWLDDSSFLQTFQLLVYLVS